MSANYLIKCLSILLCFNAWAAVTPIDLIHINAQQTDAAILQLYHNLNTKPSQDLTARIVAVSEQLLNKPYLLGALGEGSSGTIDQAPLYRLDAFDCETYVDTVLALAFGKDLKSFRNYIRHIRYRNGKISFTQRNHFTCLDWNRNNQEAGYLQDITSTFVDKQHHSLSRVAETTIDKAAWYAHFTSEHVRLAKPEHAEQQQRLMHLQHETQHIPPQISTISYIPLTAFFDDKGHTKLEILRQIPQGAVIEIVRPNWDLTKEIGTHMNVSHLGLAIWHQHTLMFREASSKAHKIIDTPLDDYLRQALASPTIKGINIQIAKAETNN